jgi:hypothetical protein
MSKSSLSLLINIIAGLAGSYIGQAIFGHWGPHLAGMALVPSILGEFRKAERTRLEKEKATNAQKNRSHTFNFCFFYHRRPVKNDTTATTTIRNSLI